MDGIFTGRDPVPCDIDYLRDFPVFILPGTSTDSALFSLNRIKLIFLA